MELTKAVIKFGIAEHAEEILIREEPSQGPVHIEIGKGHEEDDQDGDNPDDDEKGDHGHHDAPKEPELAPGQASPDPHGHSLFHKSCGHIRS